MKRVFLLYLYLLIAINSIAQKGIDGLIQAETNFAAYSVMNGVKDAFLSYMDSSSLVFDKNKPVSGIQLWTSREKRKGILNWRPAYAEISVSNDFGYTTGPWTFRLSASDSIIARGYYTTLWNINKEGKWTFLVDLGIDNTPEAFDSKLTKISAPKTSVPKTDTALFINSEKDFIRMYKENNVAAYNKYLSANALINHNGNLPVTNIAEIDSFLMAGPPAIQFTIQGWKISPGRDMACVYGVTSLNDAEDNYMRIWRHEKNGWKIAVEVIRH